ncbi:relaxase MobL [Staphylococcus pseudintermedius]|nr:relaxase MobL [Staphylococcus pseudintermedius]
MRAGIILKSQFNVSKFTGYLDYINKKQKEDVLIEKIIDEQNEDLKLLNKNANKNSLKSFSNYIIGYMNNANLKKEKSNNVKKVKKRTTAPFNDSSNQLSESELQDIKNFFDKAEKSGNVNYQDIISFDNQFLIKHGLYEESTDTLNEGVIKKATRKMMKRMIKDEKMNPFKTKWMANIHYDTDNIHIHISTTEENNTRKFFKNENGETELKGKRSQKTLDNMKSSFANSLLDSRQLLEKVTLHRNELYNNFALENIDNKLFMSINRLKIHLPENRKDWQYNNKKVKHLQKNIDGITSLITKRNQSTAMNEYKESVANVADFYREVYGENSKAMNYVLNKDKDMNRRRGNKLLKELKKTPNHNISFQNTMLKFHRNNMLGKKMISRKTIYRINKAINDEAKEYRNELAHEQLKQKIEYQNQIDDY